VNVSKKPTIAEVENEPKATDPPPPVAPTKRTAPTLEFLAVPFTDAEILTMAETMARLESERETLEEQFEVIKLDHKHKLEDFGQSIRALSRKIKSRHHYENVDCFYILEEPSPAEKTLVRRDTGEIVRVVPMQSHDFQDKLPLALKPDPVDTSSTFSLEAPADGKAAAAGHQEEKTGPVH